MTRACQPATPAPEDALLTIAQAAARLEVSRPYVSILCDAGTLGVVIVTDDGRRRIHASAVEAYLAARAKQSEGGASPRQAGVEAGLYDHPDDHLRSKIRQEDTGKPTEPSHARTSRKSRS